MTTTVAIATHLGAPHGTRDDLLLGLELERLGVQVVFRVWNEEGIDWSEGSIVVVRSVWDYHLTRSEWFEWLDLVSGAARLVNPFEQLRWNSEKIYLIELSDAGMPVIPTVLLDRSGGLSSRCNELGWGDVIVKPTFGASSYGVRRFRGHEISEMGESHLASLLHGGGALLQPYRPVVEHARKRSLVFIGGTFSHAFDKPGFHAGMSSDVLRAYVPDASEIAIAASALEVVARTPEIARIDLLPTEGGVEIMEMELVDPELAFHLSIDGAARLARCVANLI